MPSRPETPADVPDLIAPTLMADWVWHHLARGADWHSHAFHLLTMATVTPDGRPAARIMTNRGVDRATGRMWFYTRMDTPKVCDLRAHSCVCVLGFDPAQGVQLRLSGTAHLHQHDAVAEHHWEHIADVSQWLFKLSVEEGAATVGIDPRLPHDHDLLAKGLTAKSRAQFGVLQVAIESIDWYQSNGSQQRRAILHSKDRWLATLVD